MTDMSIKYLLTGMMDWIGLDCAVFNVPSNTV